MKYLIILLLFSGCATAENARIETRTDKFDGYTITEVKGNHVPGPLLHAGVQLNPQQIIGSDDSITHTIIAEYHHDDWLFIEEGESLVFLIDGEKHAVSTVTTAISREVLHGGYVRERVVYIAEPVLFDKIGLSEEVVFKLIGDDYYVERKLSDKNKMMFSRFYNMHARQD